MGRRFISKLAIFLIFATLVLFILGKTTEIDLGGFSAGEIAGILSIAIGFFSFIQQKMLSRRTKVHHFIFQLLMVLTGVVTLVPAIYDYIKSRNAFADGIIVGTYTLLLFSVAYATRDEHVNRDEVRQAESMLVGDFSRDKVMRKMQRRSRKK